MENKREKQNALILEMLGDMVNSGAIKDETSAIIYIGGFLGDISKSLAIIADSLNATKLPGSEQERWLNGE